MLCGVSGSGKSTFAHQHFPTTTIVSSDKMREAITDDELNQKCNQDAFELYYALIDKRLKWGRNVVADATHLTPSSRAKLLEMVVDRNVYAVVFDLPKDVLLGRDASRPVPRGAHVIEAQYVKLGQTIKHLTDKDSPERSLYKEVIVINE